jgi:hypothetical protein
MRSVWSASREWEQENGSGSKGARVGECLEGSMGRWPALLLSMRWASTQCPMSCIYVAYKWAR